MSIKLTIVVPTYLREEVLVETVRQIIAYRDPETMEILVIDQTPEHDALTYNYLQETSEAGILQWIRVAKPSLTHARNVGLKAACGDIVLYLDDDIQVPSNLFQEHLKSYSDGVDAVTGQVYNCIDPYKPPDMTIPCENTYKHIEIDHAQPAVNISGGNHSIRKKVAVSIGGYDELFIGSAMTEDLDFARRLIANRYNIWYNPKAWIIHLRWPSGGCGVSGETIWPEWTHTANLFLYAFRHGRQQDNFWYYIWLSIRTGPLRKEVIKHPQLWFTAWIGWLKGMKYGYVYRKMYPKPI